MSLPIWIAHPSVKMTLLQFWSALAAAQVRLVAIDFSERNGFFLQILL
jgi:hypothetical protein